MKSEQNKEQSSQDSEIPGMNLNTDQKYSERKNIPSVDMSNAQKEMEKTKKELEKFKSFALKKYPFVQAMGILPPQSIKLFIDEEEAPKETEKYMHLYVLMPEEKLKEFPKIKSDLVKQLETLKQKVWLHLKTPVDIWEMCLDSKFELTGAVAMSFPLFDKGVLGALRVCEIHKSLVLQKFEKYVVSYVIGGSLVRGEAVITSDVDVFIIINDTDVKRMPRLELLERLRGIIYQYIGEASALAGVKNKLNVQVYLLTDFWQSVKDAHPVIFTFIRDGIPIYDRGTFMPWKALLKMGKLKPSPEAIDMFMSMGDKTVKYAKQSLMDILVRDIYWGIVTPSQALLMLNGSPPPTPKQLVSEMKKNFVENEKMLEKKYIDIVERVVNLYKDYEHEKLKEIKGEEIDRLIKDSEDYLKRLKDLREQIQKRFQEKTIEQVQKDVTDLLKNITGSKSQSEMLSLFEKNFVKKGKFTQQHMRILEDVMKAKAGSNKDKLNPLKVDDIRKNATLLINDLIEYSQRAELMTLEKGRMRLKYQKAGKEVFADLLVSGGESFLIEQGNNIKKLLPKVQNSNMKELTDAIERQKVNKSLQIDPKIFDVLRREIGEYEIIL
ncbi:MAG: nucleotidyltransferase domain-containing protein [Candidatus Pacearchaeota archaeon]